MSVDRNPIHPSSDFNATCAAIAWDLMRAVKLKTNDPVENAKTFAKVLSILKCPPSD